MGGEGRGELERTGLRDKLRDLEEKESIILQVGKEGVGEGSSFMVVEINTMVKEINILVGRVFVVVLRGKWKGGGWRSSL